jgi:glycosyltransferase involved in cell wall biosynthesis
MFSVVITTFDRVELLTRALRSLILQTEQDWEAIVIDDGSNDDTCNRILPFLFLYQNIKYIWKEHSGAVSSKNKGIQYSGGKFITFLDSDDEYHKHHLESRKKILIRNSSVRFIYGGAKIIGNQFVPDKNDPSVRINLHKCAIGGTYFIERKTLLSLYGFRDIILGSDADLIERAMKASVSMAEVKLPTYIYHHENSDSITNQLFLKVNPPA